MSENISCERYRTVSISPHEPPVLLLDTVLEQHQGLISANTHKYYPLHQPNDVELTLQIHGVLLNIGVKASGGPERWRAHYFYLGDFVLYSKRALFLTE